MSEVPQKRVMPSRERRESVNKRRDLTPPTKSSPAKNSRGKEYVRGPYNTKKSSVAVVVRDTSTPGVEETLRTKVDTGPIPTTKTQQPESLSSREYQSIAESAVLAAALHRSRLRWLCEGIFDKHWVKPVKKKGVSDVPPDNPDQRSMTKMQGTVTVTIEPHVFDAIFYTVREIPLPPPPQPKHPNQHVKPAPPLTGYYPPGWGPPVHQPGISPQQNVPDRTATLSSRPPSGSSNPPDHVPGSTPDTKDIKLKGGSPDTRPIMDTRDIRLRGGAPGPAPGPPPGPPAPSPAPADAPKSNPDPVIQMLASRAATDPHLKELMKQVATSKASPAQLKEFQSHIDEFNAVIKRQHDVESKRPGPGRPPSKSNTPASKPATPAASHPAMYSSPVPPSGRGTPIYSTPPHAGYPPYPPPPVNRPTPRPEPAITAIVFELATAPSYNQSASQDRWLFPTHAVLDTPHSGRGLEMIVSWYVERTGEQIKKTLGITPEDEAGSQKWKNDTTYFQPVTMKLNSTVHKPLMTIAVNAKSLPDVQSYMESVMKTKTRPQEEWLALRLPKPGADLLSDMDGHFRDSGVDVDEEEDEVKDFYEVL